MWKGCVDVIKLFLSSSEPASKKIGTHPACARDCAFDQTSLPAPALVASLKILK